MREEGEFGEKTGRWRAGGSKVGLDGFERRGFRASPGLVELAGG